MTDCIEAFKKKLFCRVFQHANQKDSELMCQIFTADHKEDFLACIFVFRKYQLSFSLKSL